MIKYVQEENSMMKNIFYLASVLCLVLGVGNTTEAADKIRVGYEENYGLIKSSSTHDLPGFGYEYLNKIVEYTNDDYEIEFVPCSLDEGLYLLRIGLIDLYAPAVKTEEWEEAYLFSAESFAREVRFLAPTEKDYVPTGDGKELEGKTIAVQLGDPMFEKLELFLKEENISAKIEELEIKSYSKILENSEYDYVFVSSLLMDEDVTVAFVISTHETFLMAQPHMTYLMDDLNQAMESLDYSEYMYRERLFFQYFNQSFDVSEEILKSDYELMKLKNTYYVGIHDTDSPFSYFDKENQISGIYPELLTWLGDQFGVEFEFIVFEDVGSSQLKEKIDFSVLNYQSQTSTTSPVSDVLFDLPFQLVKRPSSSKTGDDTVIGVLSYHDLTLEDINPFTQGEQLFETSSSTELLLAFQQGAVDVMFIPAVTVETMKLDLFDSVVLDVDFVYSPRIIFSDDFPVSKIEILNKGLRKLETLDVEYLLKKELLPEEQKESLKEMLINYPIFLQSGLTLLLMGSLLLFGLERNRKRKFMNHLYVDELTGLGSEIFFKEQVSKVLKESKDKYSLVSGEINRFHTFQELYDKKQTTAMLHEFSGFIQSFQPTFSCHSGEGLFLFLVETSKFKDEIQKHLTQDSEIIQKCGECISGNHSVSFTFGYCEEKNSQDIDELISFAQYAQFWGVSSSYNHVHEFDEDMKSNQRNSLEILSKIDEALKNKEFQLYFQPVMNIFIKELVGIEAFVRWFRNEEILEPDHFISLLEEHGFISLLDFEVLEQACQFIKSNKDEKLPILWVNFSKNTLLEVNFLDKLKSILEKFEISPVSLGIELKESIFMDSYFEISDIIVALKQLGCSVAMDNFGANIAILSMWSEVSVDFIKLHREFLLRFKEKSKMEESLKQVLKTAEKADISVVVECVETKEEAAFLQRMGCAIAQGFYFARPMNEEKFISEIKKIKRTLYTSTKNEIEKSIIVNTNVENVETPVLEVGSSVEKQDATSTELQNPLEPTVSKLSDSLLTQEKMIEKPQDFQRKNESIRNIPADSRIIEKKSINTVEKQGNPLSEHDKKVELANHSLDTESAIDRAMKSLAMENLVSEQKKEKQLGELQEITLTVQKSQKDVPEPSSFKKNETKFTPLDEFEP